MPWLASLATAWVIALAEPVPTTGPEVGRLPLRISDDISDLDQTALGQRFSEGVSRSGFRSTELTARCDDAACYRDVGASVGVALLLGGNIDRRGPDFAVEVFAIDATTGEVVATVDGICEICGVIELGDIVDNLAARLRPAVENAIQPTTLTVETDPSGADVYLDGEHVGTTPLEIPARAGEHRLEVVKPGRKPELVHATLRAGVNEAFSFRLARSGHVPPWIPWAALGSGVASLGAGIGLLVIDGHPIERDCNPDPAGNCEFLRDTVVGGTLLTVAGVGLLGTGIGLLIVRSRRDRPSRSRAAARWPPPSRATTLRLVPGPGGAALRGRF